MKSIKVVTTDDKIWNLSSVQFDIVQSMIIKQPFEINLINEGPDLTSLGLYDTLHQLSEYFDFSLNNITIRTCNLLEKHDQIKIIYNPPLHLLDYAKEYILDERKHKQLKHFGIFIGRSNAPRLHLASYLNQNYSAHTIMSYHFNIADDFHVNNIGLEDLIKKYNIQDLCIESDFISQCPIRLKKSDPVIHNKNSSLNHAQQLLKNDFDYFTKTYLDFFVEIVCESYFTGNTFFPTEKIYRPILLKTPFIVQGPQYFLHNLRSLGFKTFDRWWDEGYTEDPATYQISEIKKVLNNLSTKTVDELYKMYTEMAPILEHNYQVAMSLESKDFRNI